MVHGLIDTTSNCGFGAAACVEADTTAVAATGASATSALAGMTRSIARAIWPDGTTEGTSSTVKPLRSARAGADWASCGNAVIAPARSPLFARAEPRFVYPRAYFGSTATALRSSEIESGRLPRPIRNAPNQL